MLGAPAVLALWSQGSTVSGVLFYLGTHGDAPHMELEAGVGTFRSCFQALIHTEEPETLEGKTPGSRF